MRVMGKITTYHFFDTFRDALAQIATGCKVKFTASSIKHIQSHVCQNLKVYKLWSDMQYELEWIDIEEGSVYERIYILEHKLDQLLSASSSNKHPSKPTSATQDSTK